ncbi:MAG: hypothetical protein E5Y25_08385, partial [Mesorhizobium sp.]
MATITRPKNPDKKCNQIVGSVSAAASFGRKRRDGPGKTVPHQTGCLRAREKIMNPSYRWVIVAAGALMTCVALG